LSSTHTTVFLRDDDVGRLTAGLRAVVELLIEEEVPCNYQVVPAFLDAETADWLAALRSRHPERIVLNQHGFQHAQVLRGRPVYSEFAGGRPYAEQHRDIAAGRDRLRAALGDAFDASIFTPPCHKYDGSTVRALQALGFRVLSAGVRIDLPARLFYRFGRALGRATLLGQRISYHPGPRRGVPGEPPLVDVSVCIDVDEEKDATGARIEKDADRLWREFERARTRTDCVGVMLHHDLYDRAGKLAALRTFVGRLKAEPGVRFATIGAIAAAHGARDGSPAAPPAGADRP